MTNLIAYTSCITWPRDLLERNAHSDDISMGDEFVRDHVINSVVAHVVDI